MIRFAPASATLVFAIGLGYGLAAAAQTPITAVPPAEYRQGVSEKSAPVTLLLAGSAPAFRVALGTPTTAERGSLKIVNALSNKGAHAKARALAVGFGRRMPASSQSMALVDLPWQSLPDGSRGARVEVVSTGAAALRVALTLPAGDPDLEVRFAGEGADAPVFGPVPANRIAAETATYGKYWSPVVTGEAIVVELHASADALLADARLGLSGVSHQLVAPASLRHLDSKTASDIGRSGACNIDVKCEAQTAAFVNAGKAVAQILFTQEDGNSYLCTGQLLNDSTQSFTPYFFTANHCINSATAARTINTFWFFDAVACGSKDVPAYIQQTAGAALLARSEDFDWVLTRLNAPPPTGTFFSAWRADPLVASVPMEVIHHPSGDLKKWARGSTTGFFTYDDGSSFMRVVYAQGTTEGGSSGAGLLTFNSSGGFYEVRGGLFGGEASCDLPNGYDEYSRLDNMLPLTRQYLIPNQGNGFVVAVEFYNAALGHYFLSTDPGEINDLDTGVHQGWVRTGLRFLAYDNPAAGTSPVCRFYRAPAFGDSHFYSASPAECAATAAAHPVDWVYESANVFYIVLPNQATGACPAATRPIWRFFNQATTNHRYTADVTLRDEMRFDPTWIAEGYGPDAVIMCSPVGS